MKKNTLNYWFVIAMSILFWPAVFIGCHFLNADKEYTKGITPRNMNGLDTIRANDSLYIINFTIQKVMPDTIPNESQDKYDYDGYDYHE